MNPQHHGLHKPIARQTEQQADTWQTAPMQFITAQHCPACRSMRYETVRSTAGDEGTRERRCRCEDCGQRFIVVIEPPG